MHLFKFKIIERAHPSQHREDHVLTEETILARSPGALLDFCAPDPAVGAVFEIEVLKRDVRVLDQD